MEYSYDEENVYVVSGSFQNYISALGPAFMDERMTLLSFGRDQFDPLITRGVAVSCGICGQCICVQAEFLHPGSSVCWKLFHPDASSSIVTDASKDDLESGCGQSG